MTRVHSAEADELRVIMCVAFDHRAPSNEVKRFKECLAHCTYVVHSMQLTGTFDFMAEASFKNLAEYHEKLETLNDIASRLVARFEACFVCKKFVRENGDDKAIWVPCHQGLQRVECARIDMIQAEGDYMRVHSGPQSWLVHMTMADLTAKLDPGDFVCVHRSLTLRCGYIERMLHEGRRWVARLQNGEHKNVARGHVREVLCALGIEPPPSNLATDATTAKRPNGSGRSKRARSATH